MYSDINSNDKIKYKTKDFNPKKLGNISNIEKYKVITIKTIPIESNNFLLKNL